MSAPSSAIGPGALTLAIEMSNPTIHPDPMVAGEVALGVREQGGANRPLGVERITQDSQRDDALARTIDRLLRAQGVRPAQLGCVAVSAGPGGFTSVRVAVTTAKVIAEAVGCGVSVIPTDEVLARSAVAGRQDVRTIAVTLAGKRDTAWCAVFDVPKDPGGAWPAPLCRAVLDAGAFASDPIAGRVIAAALEPHTPAGFRSWAQASGIELLTPTLSACATLEAAAYTVAVDPAMALPIYPREPEAVTKWRDLHG